MKVDGQRRYFEWINAGHYIHTTARGTMSMGQQGRVSHLYFGFGDGRLLIRLDLHGGTARERFADISTLRLAFHQPEGYEMLVAHPDWSEPILQLYHRDVPVSDSGLKAAVGSIFELAIPLKTLRLTTDDPVRLWWN